MSEKLTIHDTDTEGAEATEAIEAQILDGGTPTYKERLRIGTGRRRGKER